MKNIKVYILVAMVFASGSAYSQGSILMKIPGITPAAGETIIAFEGNTTLTAPPVSGGGGGGSKPVFDDIKIQKNLSISSQLIKNLTSATHMPTVEFDFLDNSNTLTYKIILTDVLLTKFSYLSPQCPNCQKLTNEVWFNFIKIQYTDVVNNIVINYDRSTNITN